MGVHAGVLDGPVVALLRVLLVLFVDSFGTVPVGQAVVCQVDLQHAAGQTQTHTHTTESTLKARTHHFDYRQNGNRTQTQVEALFIGCVFTQFPISQFKS